MRFGEGMTSNEEPIRNKLTDPMREVVAIASRTYIEKLTQEERVSAELAPLIALAGELDALRIQSDKLVARAEGVLSALRKSKPSQEQNDLLRAIEENYLKQHQAWLLDGASKDENVT